MSNAISPAFKTVVMFYGAHMLPRLRGMTREQLIAVTQQASDVSARVPVHMHPVADLSVPLWGSRPVSGGSVAALMAFGLFVLCNEDEHVAAPLLDAWPIREGVALCDGPEGPRRVMPQEQPAEEGRANADDERFPLLALIEAAGRGDAAR